MKKIWMHKANSYQESAELDKQYYSASSPNDRLSDVQFCREQYFKLKKVKANENRKRFRSIIKVIQPA